MRNANARCEMDDDDEYASKGKFFKSANLCEVDPTLEELREFRHNPHRSRVSPAVE
jgi:hypothetical protein